LEDAHKAVHNLCNLSKKSKTHLPDQSVVFIAPESTSSNRNTSEKSRRDRESLQPPWVQWRLSASHCHSARGRSATREKWHFCRTRHLWLPLYVPRKIAVRDTMRYLRRPRKIRQRKKGRNRI